MTHKQLAEEIVKKFKFYPGMDRSKKCAIIHVKGILNLQNQKDGKWLPATVPDSINHWQSILKEIEKL